MSEEQTQRGVGVPMSTYSQQQTHYEPTFAQPQYPVYPSQPQYYPPQQSYPPPPAPNGNYNDATHQAESKAFFYGGIGCCASVLALIIIVGLLIKVPWLGLFGVVSLVPSMLILWLVYWRSQRHTASLNRISKFLALGMLGVLPVALIEYLIGKAYLEIETATHMVTIAQILVGSFVNAFVIASLCEESFKFLVAWFIKPSHGDTPHSVLVYSMCGALGLATLENMMYIILVGMTGNFVLTVFTAVTRAFMAVPLHASTGIIIGAGIAERRFGLSNKNILQIIWVPFVLHGVYDFCAMVASGYITAYPDRAWIMFMTAFSLATTIVAIWYARRRRNQILAAPAHPYTPVVASV